MTKHKLLTFIDLSVRSVSSYYKQIWVDDPNHDCGGSKQSVEYRYPKPYVNVKANLHVEMGLEIGGIYTDGILTGKATSANTIDISGDFPEFKVPKEFVLVGSTYKEGQERGTLTEINT